MALTVGCMDGALALIRRRGWRTRRYMSSIVYHSLRNYATEEFYFFEGKGGTWRYWDRRVFKFLKKHNQTENRLLLVGKSYGGKDITDALIKLYALGFVFYDRIDMLIIDTTWIARNNEPLIVPGVNTVHNYYQTNGPLCGAVVKATSAATKVVNKNLTGNNIDHFGIISRPEVSKTLISLIKGIE